MIRQELTGMLPAAISRFGELLEKVAGLEPKIVSGYDASKGKGSFFYWGVACRIQCTNMEVLKAEAEGLSILWLSDDGDMAYTDGLSIDDFQTYHVNGNLELTPEGKV